MTIMPKQPIAIIIMGLAVFGVVLLSAHLTATPGWGADKAVAQATLTLDIKNEPLRSVLGKITKTTKWKIKVPDKWLDKPVTQTLNKVTLEEGLRTVLNNAGIENLLLLYDEERKVVTLFDTESAQKQSANRSSTQAQPPVVSAPAEPDPRLQGPMRDAPPRPARASRRTKRQSSDDD
jgi:hypothetical protein